MSIRSNGSYIGPRPTGPSSTVASGIWDLRSAERQKRAAAWPGPPFAPTDIGGLKLWLDASDSSTLFNATSGGSAVAADGTVARWEDKSGNANHFTSSDGPQRKTAVHNSLDTVRFDSKQMSGFTPSTVFSGASAASCFAVIRVDTAPGALFDSIGSAGDNWMPFVGNGKIYDDFASDTRRDTGYVMSLNTLQVVQMESSASNWRLLINGVQQFSAGSNTVAFRSSAAALGANQGQFGGPMDLGDICEVILYSSVLSSTNRQSVENYLMTKWGIS